MMCLRFVFLLITRVEAWLRLSRREDTWKTAEILILRHQVTVLQRRRPCRPRLNWADRALLAALLAVIPKARRRGLRLLVTPETIVRWHRDIVRRRWALIVAEFGRCGGPMGVAERHTCLVLRLARACSEVWPVAADRVGIWLTGSGRSRGRCARRLTRTGSAPTRCVTWRGHLEVSRPGRAAGDRLGCSHQLALGVAFQPWDSRSV